MLHLHTFSKRLPQKENNNYTPIHLYYTKVITLSKVKLHDMFCYQFIGGGQSHVDISYIKSLQILAQMVYNQRSVQYIQLRQLYTRLKIGFMFHVYVVDILQRSTVRIEFSFFFFSTRTSFSVVAPNRTSQRSKKAAVGFIAKDNVKILRIYQGFSIKRNICLVKSENSLWFISKAVRILCLPLPLVNFHINKK